MLALTRHLRVSLLFPFYQCLGWVSTDNPIASCFVRLPPTLLNRFNAFRPFPIFIHTHSYRFMDTYAHHNIHKLYQTLGVVHALLRRRSVIASSIRPCLSHAPSFSRIPFLRLQVLFSLSFCGWRRTALLCWLICLFVCWHLYSNLVLLIIFIVQGVFGKASEIKE